jgi:OH-DDVA oxygenase
MARIVLGLGSSHTPLLTLPATEWAHRAAADYANPKLNFSDGRLVNYGELLAEVGDRYGDVVSVEELQRKAEISQAALDRLADELEAADPDVVIIVGDDQEELFGPANQPAVAIYYGETVYTSAKFGAEDLPDWMLTVGEGYMMDDVHCLPGAPELALEMIRGLIDRNVDVAVAARVDDVAKAAFGHAYGFIVNRLFKGRRIPILPVLLNTYYPPNVPSAARCHDIGKALRSALDASHTDLRVAIIASGGLSHFIVDEELDRNVIAGFSPGQAERLRSLPRGALNSGSSEILNWVLMAGVLGEIPLTWCEYQPIYRTPAGTGVGVAFAVWSGREDQLGAAQ